MTFADDVLLLRLCISFDLQQLGQPSGHTNLVGFKYVRVFNDTLAPLQSFETPQYTEVRCLLLTPCRASLCNLFGSLISLCNKQHPCTYSCRYIHLKALRL